MNAYIALKKMIELDNEILELSSKLSKSSNVSDRERIEREIDGKLLEQLNIKHKLEKVIIYI